MLHWFVVSVLPLVSNHFLPQDASASFWVEGASLLGPSLEASQQVKHRHLTVALLDRLVCCSVGVACLGPARAPSTCQAFFAGGGPVHKRIRRDAGHLT